MDTLIKLTTCDLESDDSRSTVSHSDDNGLTGAYTSDDSADITQASSTCIDSDVSGYLTQTVDECSSRQLLFESECPTPEPSGLSSLVYSHDPALLPLQFTSGSGLDPEDYEPLNDDEPEVEICQPLMELSAQDYQPLSEFCGDLTQDEFETDTVRTSIKDPLTLVVEPPQIPLVSKPLKECWMVGNVPIDPKYRDAFFVNWPWKKIRSACVFINYSIVVISVCIGIGLLRQLPQNDCKPVQEWYQGGVNYHIFIPSFKDSDNDGIGDLMGIVSEIDYIEDLGVSSIQLSSVFLGESSVTKNYGNVTNYNILDPQLGRPSEFQLLCALLHERGIFLLLDVPFTLSNFNYTKDTSEKFDIQSYSGIHNCPLDDVTQALKHWIHWGVDGFFFPDLHRCLWNPKLYGKVQNWRNILDLHPRGLNRRVMMAPLMAFRSVDFPPSSNDLLKLFDLVDANIDLSGYSTRLSSTIYTALSWSEQSPYPCINWNMDGIGLPRVAQNVDTSILGRIMLLLFLPGSATIFYGEELGIGFYSASHKSDSWAALMQWSREKNGGFSSQKPWKALSSDWIDRNVLSLNGTLDTLKKVTSLRQNEVPLYIDGLNSFEGEFKPVKSSNLNVQLIEENLIVMDRFYPRRNKFMIVVNLGQNVSTPDLSSLYYGGQIRASSHRRTGYIKFRDLVLMPGEAIICELDK